MEEKTLTDCYEFIKESGFDSFRQQIAEKAIKDKDSDMFEIILYHMIEESILRYGLDSIINLSIENDADWTFKLTDKFIEKTNGESYPYSYFENLMDEHNAIKCALYTYRKEGYCKQTVIDLASRLNNIEIFKELLPDVDLCDIGGCNADFHRAFIESQKGDLKGSTQLHLDHNIDDSMFDIMKTYMDSKDAEITTYSFEGNIFDEILDQKSYKTLRYYFHTKAPITASFALSEALDKRGLSHQFSWFTKNNSYHDFMDNDIHRLKIHTDKELEQMMKFDPRPKINVTSATPIMTEEQEIDSLCSLLSKK